MSQQTDTTPNHGSSSLVQPTGLPEIPDYTVVGKLGSGTFGDVWIAESVAGGACALKTVHRSRFSTELPYKQEFQGIQNAIEITRSTGPLATIYHVGLAEEDGFFYYTMELADPNPVGPI